MELSEQIQSLEAKLASNFDRLEAIAKEAGESGKTMDEAHQEEFDTIESENERLRADLKRFKSLEKARGERATPAGGHTPDNVNRQEQTDQRGTDTPVQQIRVRAPQLPKGIAFARVVKCMGMARGDWGKALHIAETRYRDHPQIAATIKADVAGGTAVHSTWAGPLVGDETSVFADFVEFLRPQTIIGRFGTDGIPSLRQVPFRTALIGQTSGGQGYWVGEAKAKPLTKFDFNRRTLEPLKVANIVVTTEELLRDSSPSAEAIVRDQMAEALRATMDVGFIDPSEAGTPGLQPASITEAPTPIPSSGNDAESIRQDIRALFNTFIEANNTPTSGVWIMPATVALALSLLVNPLSTQPEFPGITMRGGTLFGLPVIVSQHVPTVTAGTFVFLVNAGDIYLADDGGIAVDMSREASLQMDDAPTQESDSPPTATAVVSLWQTNSVGFRAERTINWLARRDSAVAVLSEVNWGEGTGA